MPLCGVVSGQVALSGEMDQNIPISSFLVLLMASSPTGSCCNIGMPQGPTSPLPEVYVTED